MSALKDALQQSREAMETLRASIPAHATDIPQLFSLNAMLTDVLKLATPILLSTGIVVEWLAPKQDVCLHGHMAQLSNVFKQLVNNAIDAINTRREGKREIRLSCVIYDNYVEIAVEDSGAGIADELRYKVFEPFYTTKGAAKQHLGLGLAMAQEAVTHHGGVIDIDTSYRTGCRMRVQLPLGKQHV